MGILQQPLNIIVKHISEKKKKLPTSPSSDKTSLSFSPQQFSGLLKT